MNFAVAVFVILATWPFWIWVAAELIDGFDDEREHGIDDTETTEENSWT